MRASNSAITPALPAYYLQKSKPAHLKLIRSEWKIVVLFSKSTKTFQQT